MSLKTKILLLSLFLSLMGALIGGSSYIYTHKVLSKFDLVVGKDVPAIRSINRMLLSFRLIRVELLQLCIPKTQVELDKESIDIISDQWSAFDTDANIYASFISSEEENLAFMDFKKNVDQVRVLSNKIVELYHVNPGENSKERKEMMRIVTSEIAGELAQKIRITTKKLIDLVAEKIEKNSNLANTLAESSKSFILLFTILGSIAGMLTAFFLSLKITRMTVSTLASISSSVTSVKRSASEITATSQSLSESVTEQAAALQETTSAIEEISSMIARSSDNTSDAKNLAQSAQTHANEGQGIVTQMVDAINEISESNKGIMNQIDQSNQKMIEIVKVIQDIGDKTKVINDIVFQTKLLSFNASVEAARAGEHGKGFAVVAVEIGNLAQMSGNAAKEISTLLESSTAKVESILEENKAKVSELISIGKHKIESGVSLANNCNSALERIVKGVSQISSITQDISVAGQEQSVGILEINKAISELDKVTQQNSNASQSAASAAKLLLSETESLETTVSQYATSIIGVAANLQKA